MHRTNIYLTEEQEQALDARARAARTTRSAVLREILDRALAEPSATDDDIEGAFATLADGYDELIAGVFDDDDDLRIA